MRIRRVAQAENVVVEGFVGDEVARAERIGIGRAMGLEVVVVAREGDRSVLGGRNSYVLRDGSISHTGHIGTFRVDGVTHQRGDVPLRDGALVELLDCDDANVVALAFSFHSL